MNNAWPILLCVITLCIVFYYGQTYVEHKKQEIHEAYEHTIQGIFMNHEKNQRSVFRTIKPNVFLRVRQGVSRMMDQTWTFDGSRYLITLTSYAILSKHIITVYEDDVAIESLTRAQTPCKPILSSIPCYETMNTFMISAVPVEQQDDFALYLRDEKHCASCMEWNIPIGPTSNHLMAKGLFLVDLQKTSFFFLQEDVSQSIMEFFPAIPQKVLDLDEFRAMAFGGSGTL